MRRIALAILLWLLCGAACAAEQRVALVIGNAGYRFDPLDNPVNDARLVASSLKQAGFDVTLAENLDRRGLLGALRAFGERLTDNSVAVLYYAGHGLQLRDRNYLIPVDAEMRSEDEIPLAGIDIAFILGRMSAAKSRVNIVILDACRNNPFAGKSIHTAQGLAQMDAPVGTLLAYATAPGKLAADGLGGVNDKNGLYAQQLARQLLAPGLPVEHVFKRVREAVVRASREAQVPWESSSLQGEFSFVPALATARDGAADVEAAAELAFWNSVQGTSRADDLRAYLRQYPRGRFAALAQSRLDAAALAPAVAVAPAVIAANTQLPRVGDSWRYRVQDQFRLGDLFVTAKVEQVSDQGIAESRTTSADTTPRSTRVALAASFGAMHDASPAPAEFAPYLQAAGLIGPALRSAELSQQVEQATVPLHASVEGIEDVQVAAGRFRAQKVVLRGQALARGAAKSGVVITEHRLWYATEVKRVIKHEITTTVGGALRQSTSVELVEFSVR
jgi:Caspase domain